MIYLSAHHAEKMMSLLVCHNFKEY